MVFGASRKNTAVFEVLSIVACATEKSALDLVGFAFARLQLLSTDTLFPSFVLCLNPTSVPFAVATG